MSKFNHTTAKARGGAAVIDATGPETRTHQGGRGFTRDAKSELFLLAVSDMGGEATFYETGDARLKRLQALVGPVAAEDPAWMASFIGWLRNGANMRSVSLMVALESARALTTARVPGARAFIPAAMARADEPGEALAYWHARHGRRIPAPVKRGIADAATRLYTERAAIKYDTDAHAYRFADVIELTHPTPYTAGQSDLFRYLLTRRHRGADAPVPLALRTVRANRAFHRMDKDAKRQAVLTGELHQAGLTWEAVAGAIGLDAEVWAKLIPGLGYMALLRNLRNFEDAGVADDVMGLVAKRLADPDEVAKSRQLPLRFLSAYRNLNGNRFRYPLDQALNASLRNVPALPGRTLVLIDRSGSMFSPMSRNSAVTFADTAALFGTALGMRAEHGDIVVYGTGHAQVSGFRPGASILDIIGQYPSMGGTNTAGALQATFKGHDRVVILTDEQTSGWAYYGGRTPGEVIPSTTPLYTWNLAGYKAAQDGAGPNRYWMGGLTNQGFQTIPLVEAGRDATWPWEAIP